MRHHLLLALLVFSIPLVGTRSPADGDSKVATESDHLVAIDWITGCDAGGALHLAGTDAAAQLVVSGSRADGMTVDATRHVTYTSSPGGIVEVSPDGWITPQSDGRATITASVADASAIHIDVVVTHLREELPVNFPNEVVPVFTKYGCNSGGCHGKSGGQNGFRLSLLGFEPAEDYEHLVKEARGRRVFPAAADRSLLLVKATGSIPHGGSERFAVDSPSYRVLRRWVAQGMPYGSADDAKITRVEVLPRERVVQSGQSQQLAVRAHYSDGTMRDVTRVAQFESSDTELAEVSTTGLVSTARMSGIAAVMVRYQDQVDVTRIVMPSATPVGPFLPVKNFIDELVFAQLKELRVPSSGVCDDSTFIRRVTIDIAGRLPTLDETQTFLADEAPDKRDRLVDRLLQSSDYADYFANKWSAILRNRRQGGQKYSSFAFHSWIRESLITNKPYDQIVGELLAASGRIEENPAVGWYHQVRDQSSQVEDAAQLFLGLRISCARCHHHPYEKWSQQDYYGLSAFFSRLGRKPSPLGRSLEHIYHRPGAASAANPKTGQGVPATPLGGSPFDGPPSDDPRHRLVDWMTAQDNPFFARALANRYWKHFFGRGLVEPEDDLRLTNPASNPQLLDALADHFAHSGFDLKELVKAICTSRAYSLSAVPNEHNQFDRQNYARFYPRRLNAEVLLDAIDALTASSSQFAGLPAGTRSVQLPDNAFNSYLLTVFGRPDAASACECERVGNVNLAQCLHLLNSEEVRGKLAGTRATDLAGQSRPHSARIEDLYVIAFSRLPTEAELAEATAHIESAGENTKVAYEDLLWVLINTKEFLFNH